MSSASVIYLDFNRTTPTAPSVIEAMQPFWATHFLLPTQMHTEASAVGEAIERARESTAMLLGCEPFEVVFTSGGTEANNLAILGMFGARGAGRENHHDLERGESPHALVSALEHEAVLSPVRQLEAAGWDMEVVKCDARGRVDVDEFADHIRPSTRLACLQLANSVVGTVQNVRQLSDRCHNWGIHVHCDATVAAGRVPINANQLRVDTLAITGHKFYAPKGVGALFVRRGLTLQPILHGESREMGLRSGADNVPGIVGLGQAATLATRCVDEAATTLSGLRQRLVDGLDEMLGGQLVVLGDTEDCLPNTVCLELPGDASRIQRAARQLVVATAESSSPPDEITRTLRAIGRTEPQIGRTMRISIGWTTTHDQIDRAISLLAEATECPAQ
ncbi:MAG: cysteine desulfurase family protein [Planctomycetota bacterium]